MVEHDEGWPLMGLEHVYLIITLSWQDMQGRVIHRSR
ncbi:hypothetical protein AAZX31_13G081200 [Glycine max]